MVIAQQTNPSNICVGTFVLYYSFYFAKATIPCDRSQVLLLPHHELSLTLFWLNISSRRTSVFEVNLNSPRPKYHAEKSSFIYQVFAGRAPEQIMIHRNCELRSGKV